MAADPNEDTWGYALFGGNSEEQGLQMQGIAAPEAGLSARVRNRNRFSGLGSSGFTSRTATSAETRVETSDKTARVRLT